MWKKHQHMLFSVKRFIQIWIRFSSFFFDVNDANIYSNMFTTRIIHILTKYFMKNMSQKNVMIFLLVHNFHHIQCFSKMFDVDAKRAFLFNSTFYYSARHWANITIFSLNKVSNMKWYFIWKWINNWNERKCLCGLKL